MIVLSQPFNQLLHLYEKEYLVALGRELHVNRHRLDVLGKHFGTASVVTPWDVDQFFKLIKKSNGNSSRNRYRVLLKHLLKWGKQHRIVQGDLDLMVFKKEREHGERTQRVTPTEQAQLCEHMGQDTRDAFVAALDTGLRKGALTKLTFADITESEIVVPAEIQKHRQTQRIPLTARLRIIIDRREVGQAKGDRIFTGGNLDKQWKKAKKLAGIKGLHWHDLRAEFASRLEEAGVEISVVSQLLGHASLTTTQRYLRPRVERFKSAIDKLGV